MLTRQTLDGLVHLYNSVHTGNPLLLSDRKTIRRLEENNQRLSETIRDLYMYIDRREEARPHKILARFFVEAPASADPPRGRQGLAARPGGRRPADRPVSPSTRRSPGQRLPPADSSE